MKRYLVTSALPYINGIKHLGNLVGSILPADIYSKFLRQQGHEVLFICGTDEHGTPAEIAASDANMSIVEYCNKMYLTQKEIYEKFDINFDYFGRTSSESNHEITQEIFNALEKNGYIIEKEIHQYYSHTDKRFLPDRYIEGKCPVCLYHKARGDQCDGCGSLLEPERLIEPYSAISGSRDVELKPTRHIFLDLKKAEGIVSNWVENSTNWSDMVCGIARKWLKEGLEPRCISRDLSWGIKIPKEGFDGKVFYVWFDAPNGYISITKDWAISIGKNDEWKKWWFNNGRGGSDVWHVEFMAKDNVPFHSIFWPAVLLASGMDFKMVDYIKSFHWLTYEKGKFSTSQKRGVFTDQALLLFKSDYWRYYLMSHCPETSDSDFSFSQFATTVNKDLADILGNFYNRTIALVAKYFNLKTPIVLKDEEIDKNLLNKSKALLTSIKQNLYDMKFRQAIQAIRGLWVLGNEYITEKEPWCLVKSDINSAAIVLAHSLHLQRIFAIASYSIIPATSREILSLLGDEIDCEKVSFDSVLDFQYFKENHTFAPPKKLFEKISDEEVQNLTKKFSGVIEEDNNVLNP